MKPKLVLIARSSFILLIALLTSQSNGKINYEIDTLTKNDSPKIKRQFMNNQPEHLFFFVQISDLHISQFRDPQRIEEFRTFVNQTLNIIKSPVVIASGDLTDGRGKNYLNSHENDEEWETYKEILSTANVANRTKWLDLRGNHDNLNVPSSMANNSHFQRYSIQGPKHERSYMELVRDSSGDLYAFIAVDACLQPGPKIQYNFNGFLTQEDTDHIQHLVDEAKRAGVNYAIWFGHYPMSCIVTKNKENLSLKTLIASYNASLTYLCGHFHSLAGLVPHMYALQEDKFFELEVADWKKCRIYRVAAVDHGLLSFVDISFGVWPIILITNPKNALFQIPNRREAKIQLESTHIRILVFSPAGISSCNVQIDKDFKEICQQVNEHLFVVPWNPKLYREGLHHITVTVVDKSNRKNEVTQLFRLDEKQTVYSDTLAQFVLHKHIVTIFKSMFWFSIFLCVAPLIFFRIWHELIKVGLLRRMHAKCRASMSIVQHYWILASVDRIFWPIILYCFYLAVGPLMYCEIADGQYGFIFVSGIYVEGVFLPGSFTFMFGFIQLLLFQFPLIWIYAKCVAKQYYKMIGMPVKNHRGWSKNCSQILFYLIIFIEILICILFCLMSGIISFISGIFQTWSVAMNVWLYYLARNVPMQSLRSAVNVWSRSVKTLNTDRHSITGETHTN